MAGNGERPGKRSSKVPGGTAREAGDRAQSEYEADQTASALDQSAADADQTATERDQDASDRDQAAADADQQASNRDQVAADRELGTHEEDDEAGRVHEDARSQRARGTTERGITAAARAEHSAERVSNAARRDETAMLRDRTAEARDRAALDRDRAAEALERELGVPSDSLQAAARRYAAGVRAKAAADRASAAADRLRAAEDRELAARDREHARHDIEQANLDDLTGAYTRAMGNTALQGEIDRARRDNQQLVLAVVDVDGLKEFNDSRGHAAGDALLLTVVTSIRARLRSWDDPVVRYGGDEFVCSLAGMEEAEVETRFATINDDITSGAGGGSVSVGLAMMSADDRLEDVLRRGDAALYRAKPRPLDS